MLSFKLVDGDKITSFLREPNSAGVYHFLNQSHVEDANHWPVIEEDGRILTGLKENDDNGCFPVVGIQLSLNIILYIFNSIKRRLAMTCLSRSKRKVNR